MSLCIYEVFALFYANLRMSPGLWDYYPPPRGSERPGDVPEVSGLGGRVWVPPGSIAPTPNLPRAGWSGLEWGGVGVSGALGPGGTDVTQTWRAGLPMTVTLLPLPAPLMLALCLAYYFQGSGHVTWMGQSDGTMSK